MLAPSTQPWQRLHPLLGVPDLQMFRVQPDVDLFADQPAGDGVGVLLDVNQAPRIHARWQSVIALQPPFGQRTQHGLLLLEPRTAPGVAPRANLGEEGGVGRPVRKIAAAAQQQRLVHRHLEVPVRRLAVAVLVRTTRVRLGSGQPVVFQQPRITGVKFAPVR